MPDSSGALPCVNLLRNLAMGMSVEDYAAEYGVSVETVRASLAGLAGMLSDARLGDDAEEVTPVRLLALGFELHHGAYRSPCNAMRWGCRVRASFGGPSPLWFITFSGNEDRTLIPEVRTIGQLRALCYGLGIKLGDEA